MSFEKKKTVKRVGSDQPTALIAPSDYEHIFENQDEESIAKKVESKQKLKQKLKKIQKASTSGNAKRIDSDQPTALIAPSDYEHIFENAETLEEPKVPSVPKKTGKNVTRLPSDTPTALLAPSDFEHIYRDPTVGGTKAPKVKKMNRTASVKASGSKMTRNQSTQKTGSASSSSAQEVLPVSILNVVKKFVDKQKKTYTINK